MKFQSLMLPKNIWAIGLMSLCINLSSVIIFSLSPLYLTKVLGVTTLGLGFIEGIVEFISWLTRIFAGIISDIFRKRKPLLVVSVILSCLARPIFAFASSIPGIFIARVLDRLANGLQASPREALVGDSTPPQKRGASYGLRQSLGLVGSALGAILTMFWLLYFGDQFSQIFWFAAVPPVIALIVVLGSIKEKESSLSKEEAALRKEQRFQLHHMRFLPASYWRLLLVSFLFMLSGYSGSFMIIRGECITHSTSIAPAIMIVQNVCAMLIAYPMGRMFDRFKHQKLLIFGFLMVGVANTVLAFAQSGTMILLGAGLWGIQLASNQSLLTAKIAQYSTPLNRGTAFGFFYITSGTAIFLANAIVGKISKEYTLEMAFHYSTVMAVLAILSLFLLRDKKKKMENKENVKC